MDRDAYRVGGWIRGVTGPGEVRVRVGGQQDLRNPTPLKSRARGYSAYLSTREFLSLGLEYSIVAFHLRWGLWNPNFFLEDLALVSFGDALFSREGGRQTSVGLEARLEVGGYFIPRLCAPKVGVGITGEGRIGLFGGVEIGRLPY